MKGTSIYVRISTPISFFFQHQLFNAAGGRIDTDVVARFVTQLKGLLSQSFGNRKFWKVKVGKSWKSINAVRWGAAHDCHQDIMENFVEVREFLAELVTSDGKVNKTARQLLVRPLSCVGIPHVCLLPILSRIFAWRSSGEAGVSVFE